MQGRVSRSKSIYIVSTVMTTALLLSANSESPYLALLLYAFLPIGLLKPELLIPTYFISSLSSNYFSAAQGIGFTRLLALAIIAGVVVRITGRRKPPLTKWIVKCVFVAVSTFISFLLAYDNDISSLYIIGLNILVFLAMTNLSITKDELIHLFRAILLAVLITTIYYAVVLMINPYILQNGRLTIAEGINVNRFGMMMAQLSVYSLAYMFFAKKNFVKAACLVTGVANAYFVLLTGSRSALIGIALGFIFTVLISMYVQKKIKKRFFGLAILCASVVFIFYSVIELNPMLAYRMNIDEIISSGGTRRWPRIVGEIQYIIPKHPFFGVGPNSVNETISLAQYMGDPGSSHNFIVSALAQVGIVGFIAYMSFYWNIIKETILQMSTKEIFIIPLMMIMTATFNGIGEVMYSERLFWNTLSLAALCLSTYSKGNMLKDKKFPESTVINCQRLNT